VWALRNVFSYTMPWRCVPDRDFSLYDASLGHCVPWTKRPWLWWVPTLDRIQVVDKYNHRDQRGVPLLTVETEANGDSWSTYRALAALVCLVQHIFFLTAQFFNLVVPIARSYLSRQSRWIACLCVSDYNSYTQKLYFLWCHAGHEENCWLIQYAVFLGT
jgi:hypothetical protein